MAAASGTPPLYPAFLDLRDRLVVVVGGGEEAERRVRNLLTYGADVVVIAPSTTAGLDELRSDEAVTYDDREWQPADLDGAFMVVAATGSAEGDRAVFEAADGRGALVRGGTPDSSNVTVPATVRRGALLIALTTSGASAAVTKRVRERLAEEFGEEWGEYLELVAGVRELVRTSVPEPERQERVFEMLMDERWLARMRLGAHPGPEDVVAEADAEAEAEAESADAPADAEPGDAADETAGSDQPG